MTVRFLASLLVALVGCTATEPDAEVVVDTLAGGALVVHNSERGLWDEGEEWRLVEELRLGTATGAGPESFTDVRGLDVDAYGRIWVMDHQTNEIRVFDTEGEHVQTIGGTGGGPGEFRSLYGGGFDPEWRLWVFDEGQNRGYTVLDTTGTVVATFPREIWGYGYRWKIVFDETGRLIEDAVLPPGEDGSRQGALVFNPPPVGATGGGSADDPGVELQGAEGTLRTGLGSPDTVRFDETSFTDRGPGYYRLETAGGYGMIPVPFSGRGHRVIDDAPSEWVGFSDEYRIVRRSLDGDTLLVVEKEYAPVLVEDEEVERFLGRLEDAGISRDLVDTSRIPDVHPAYEFFLLENGRLWVARPEAGDEHSIPLDVFDGEGRYLGVVRSPVELREPAPWVVRDDRLYGIAFGELDVPYVVRLRIER